MRQGNWELSYTVRFSKEGWKRLNRLDRREAKKVTEKVEFLRSFRTLGTVKRMSGRHYKDIFRLRVGNIRVLFRVIEDKREVWVIDVGFRGSIYG